METIKKRVQELVQAISYGRKVYDLTYHHNENWLFYNLEVDFKVRMFTMQQNDLPREFKLYRIFIIDSQITNGNGEISPCVSVSLKLNYSPVPQAEPAV